MSEAIDDNTPPALFNHACVVYQAMLERSYEHDPGDGSRLMAIFEGRLTALITEELFYSVPYYTSITKLLKAMGSIKQLKRGGGSAPSQWEIITAPTIEKFRALALQDPTVTKTTGTRNPSRQEFEALEQQLRDLERQINNVSKAHDRLANAHSSLAFKVTGEED